MRRSGEEEGAGLARQREEISLSEGWQRRMLAEEMGLVAICHIMYDDVGMEASLFQETLPNMPTFSRIIVLNKKHEFQLNIMIYQLLLYLIKSLYF